MATPARSPVAIGDGNLGRESSATRRAPDLATGFVLGPTGSQQTQRISNSGESDARRKHTFDLLYHLSLDLSNLLNRTDISDCFLNVKGTFMAVHKCILAARSNAFAAVISGTVNVLEPDLRTQLRTDSHDGKLVIAINRTEPDIMKQVVIFMYTAKCDLDESNSYALLDAAGRYDIKDLKVHTGLYLADRINTNNVLMLLKAAYKYDNKLIKQSCIEFFIDNAKDVMGVHELWKRFAEEQQQIVAELLHWLVNKDEFFNQKPQWDATSRWD